MKNPNVSGILRGQSIRDRARSIHGTVINYDDLPIAQAERAKRIAQPRDAVSMFSSSL